MFALQISLILPVHYPTGGHPGRAPSATDATLGKSAALLRSRRTGRVLPSPCWRPHRSPSVRPSLGVTTPGERERRLSNMPWRKMIFAETARFR